MVDHAQGSAPAELYQTVRTDAAGVIARGERGARLVSLARLAVAALLVAALVQRERAADGPWTAAAVVAALGFAALVVVHRGQRAALATARRRDHAARLGLARIARAWTELPAPPAVHAMSDPDAAPWPARLARDLDVVGSPSLMQLLDVGHPTVGGARLLRWMLADPPPVAAIEARQRSVAALRREPRLLLDVAAEIRRPRAASVRAGFDRLGEWCSDPAADRPVPVGMQLTAAAATTVVLVAASRAADPAAQLAILLSVVVLVVLSAWARRRMVALHGLDTALENLHGIVRVLDRLAAAPALDGAMGEVQGMLTEDRAPTALRRLERLLEWNGIRHVPLMHWLANALGGFDVHLAAAVAGWRAAHARRAARWLDAAADAEALVALGTLAFEHPAWTMPTVHDDASAPPLAATGLAHPLLPATRAVANDLTLDRPGSAVVVSGSNMAGKTTHLRAAGLAVLLAQAGGPVSARGMRLRRCRPRTSVRIEDDLGRGASLFFAEVSRLRDVVRDAEDPAAPPVLFLLDEVLHGTNAGDRRLATAAVLRHLAHAGASGLVTTHDPAIGDAIAATHVHFDGEVVAGGADGVTLRFDYTARPGPAERANALHVLEMFGIAVNARA